MNSSSPLNISNTCVFKQDLTQAKLYSSGAGSFMSALRLGHFKGHRFAELELQRKVRKTGDRYSSGNKKKHNKENLQTGLIAAFSS